LKFWFILELPYIYHKKIRNVPRILHKKEDISKKN